MTLTTWAGNYAYGAQTVHRPRSVDELRQVVADARHVRALGTRHCFNDLGDGPEALVLLDEIAPDVVLDTAARTVTVGGGVRYGALAEHLHAAGWAVHNLASLPHISVAGAVATATHGSGDRSTNLAAAVAALTYVGPGGELRQVARGDDDFAGSVVALGALGVAARVTLDVEPTYDVAQEVHDEVPWDAVLHHYDELTASADSVSVFTDWAEPTLRQVWRKTRVTSSYAPRTDLFGGTAAASQRHMLPGIDPVNATQQGGVPGPWHERWPHFKLAFTPSNGDELQSEYLVPRRHAVGAFAALRDLGDRIAPLLQVSEVRTVAADELWLSSAYGEDVVGLHFTWLPRQPEVEALLPTIEAALAPFDARPHWGKLFADVDRDLRRLYPRWDDFRALVARVDPDGVFRNGFLDRHVLRD
ncbi:xylitol oxidase [Cellulomonas chitinilytica]|uniref:Xylitol oxidase n=1 Tax=Cellulomonas chitinilytica TaxID=398759 RepID=A0A919P1Z4_9CELL|nr:D-arabinono-1,4-lactone oxidase [Cellulomonas chitinilytica]GIG19634.1 xylitol oxidase [Cellulomonas chitinilytica]